MIGGLIQFVVLIAFIYLALNLVVGVPVRKIFYLGSFNNKKKSHNNNSSNSQPTSSMDSQDDNPFITPLRKITTKKKKKNPVKKNLKKDLSDQKSKEFEGLTADNQINFLSDVPTEILMEIFSRLNIKDLLNVGLLNWMFCNLVKSSHTLWRPIFTLRFVNKMEENFPEYEPFWKIYFFNILYRLDQSIHRFELTPKANKNELEIGERYTPAV